MARIKIMKRALNKALQAAVDSWCKIQVIYSANGDVDEYANYYY
jgi:hypothetical protein